MRRTQRRAFYWLLVLTLGWLLSKPHSAHAQAYNLNTAAEEQPSHYKSPEDLIELIPVVNHLPRTYNWGRGYIVKLSGQSLRIDHRINQTHATVKRGDCTIGFSYVTPVAGFFTSRIDLPLFYSQKANFSEVSFNRMGDYVTYFSRGTDTQSIRFLISSRF